MIPAAAFTGKFAAVFFAVFFQELVHRLEDAVAGAQEVVQHGHALVAREAVLVHVQHVLDASRSP